MTVNLAFGAGLGRQRSSIDANAAERALDGEWTVERESGLLPPLGVAKRIGGGRGATRLLGVPVACFVVSGTTLEYTLLPLRDELVPVDADTWWGAGYLFGRRFCTFRLRRAGTRRGRAT